MWSLLLFVGPLDGAEDNVAEPFVSLWLMWLELLLFNDDGVLVIIPSIPDAEAVELRLWLILSLLVLLFPPGELAFTPPVGVVLLLGLTRT